MQVNANAGNVAALARRGTGSVESHPWKDGRTVSWRLRVRAYGGRYRIPLGTNHEGWTEDENGRCPRAEIELEKILGEIERGTWKPPERDSAAPPGEVETIHLTLSRWWERKKREIEDNTKLDYEWRLNGLLAYRAQTPTVDIDEEWVDGLREHLAQRPSKNEPNKPIAPSSVNKHLDVLAQALDLALDHKRVDTNAARGKRRRMKVPKSKRPWLEPDMVVDLLDVAGEWEREIAAGEHGNGRHPEQCYGRRELLALLTLSGGPRIEEALAASRGEFDLTGGDHWRIPDSKTEAGERIVDLTFFTSEELRNHVATSPSRGRRIKHAGPMFPTVAGTQLSQNNVRRMLRGVVKRTNERREKEGKMLLPSVTPHSLRVTFASLCFMVGRDPAWVMGQIGHTDARFTLNLYTRTMRRKNIDRELVWRLMRFADEPEAWPGLGPRNGPTSASVMSGGDASISAK